MLELAKSIVYESFEDMTTQNFQDLLLKEQFGEATS